MWWTSWWGRQRGWVNGREKEGGEGAKGLFTNVVMEADVVEKDVMCLAWLSVHGLWDYFVGEVFRTSRSC